MHQKCVFNRININFLVICSMIFVITTPVLLSSCYCFKCSTVIQKFSFQNKKLLYIYINCEKKQKVIFYTISLLNNFVIYYTFVLFIFYYLIIIILYFMTKLIFFGIMIFYQYFVVFIGTYQNNEKISLLKFNEYFCCYIFVISLYSVK